MIEFWGVIENNRADLVLGIAAFLIIYLYHRETDNALERYYKGKENPVVLQKILNNYIFVGMLYSATGMATMSLVASMAREYGVGSIGELFLKAFLAVSYMCCLYTFLKFNEMSKGKEDKKKAKQKQD